jgi:divalent metal cation (Fe/Co/Zn/Cd) transporter
MTSASEQARGGREARDWSRIALWLVAATLVYNVAEGVIALTAGAMAESIALFGFGLDSLIEVAAAGVLLWRLGVEARGREGEALERTERAVHRFIGATFIALALYVTGQAGWTLWARAVPEASFIGILLAGASLVIMPAIAWGKLRAAREIGSAALRAEARETLACSYLSFALLLGLAANATLGWWWADPTAALLMVPWLVREGQEGLRGESCAESCG